MVSEEGSAAGTYICQGGVAGRINNGSRTYSGLSNAGNLTVAAGGNENYTLVGGVVGRCDEGAEITECETTGGKITYEVTESSSPLYIGGIVGYIKKPVTLCTNATEIELAEDCVVSNDLLVGGVAGRIDDAEITSCTNNATLTNACSSTTYLQLGGIVGWNNKTTLTDCENTGSVTNTADSDGRIYVGGITAEASGAVSGCENSGNIENSGASEEEWNVIGGVAGMNSGADLTECVNKGEIYNHCNATGIHIGGVTGFVNADAVYDKCTNDGEVAISNGFKVSSGDHITVGGVVGRSAAKVSYDECVNNGYVHVHISNDATRAAVYVGGIFGDNVKKDISCLNSENNGMVELYNEKSPASLQDYALGGIAGRISQIGGTTVISGCKNKNELYIKANRGIIGGIAGQFLDGQIINCTNTSKIVYSRNKSYKMYIAAGGIVGNAYGKAEKIADCFNAGEVLSLSLTGEYVMGNYVGGVIGWLEDPCVVTDCINTGTVTCSTGEKNAYVAAIAGGIIGYKESTGTDSGNKNWGVVTAIGQWVSSSDNYPAMAGGVVGALRYGTIKGCYNYGDITGGQATSLTTSTSKYNGESRAGSIAGYYTTGISPFADCEGTITQCHVGGWLKNASYSKNWKEVTSSTYGGLIVGRGDDPTDCYFAPFVEAPQPE